MVPADFIGFIEPRRNLTEHHRVLLADMLAQTEALAFGKTAEEVRAEGVVERLVAHRPSPETDRPLPSWRRR